MSLLALSSSPQQMAHKRLLISATEQAIKWGCYRLLALTMRIIGRRCTMPEPATEQLSVLPSDKGLWPTNLLHSPISLLQGCSKCSSVTEPAQAKNSLAHSQWLIWKRSLLKLLPPPPLTICWWFSNYKQGITVVFGHINFSPSCCLFFIPVLSLLLINPVITY